MARKKKNTKVSSKKHSEKWLVLASIVIIVVAITLIIEPILTGNALVSSGDSAFITRTPSLQGGEFTTQTEEDGKSCRDSDGLNYFAPGCTIEYDELACGGEKSPNVDTCGDRSENYRYYEGKDTIHELICGQPIAAHQCSTVPISSPGLKTCVSVCLDDCVEKCKLLGKSEKECKSQCEKTISGASCRTAKINCAGREMDSAFCECQYK